MVPPSWRCAADYAYLAGVDRAGLAWEWVRRNAAYRQWVAGTAFPAQRHAGPIEILDDASTALRWGLVFR